MRKAGFLEFVLLYAIATAAVLLVSLIGGLVFAEEAQPAPDCMPGFYCNEILVTAYSGTETLYKPGKDRYVNAFERIQVDASGPLGVHLIGRAELGAQPENKDSYVSAEFYVGAYHPIANSVALAGLYGYILPIGAGPGDTKPENNSEVFAGGLMLGRPRSRAWMFVGVGKHGSTQPGTRLILSGQLPLKGNVFAVGEAVLRGPAPMASTGIAFRFGGEQK